MQKFEQNTQNNVQYVKFQTEKEKKCIKAYLIL